jgi:hypothetical protein
MDAGCTHEIQSRIAMAQTEPNKNKPLLTSKLNFSAKQKPIKRYLLSIALYRAETWTLRKVNHKYLRCSEMLLEDGNQLNQAPGVVKSNL